MISRLNAINTAINYLGEDIFSSLSIKYEETNNPNAVEVVRKDNNVTIKYGELSSLFYGLSLIKLHKDESNYHISLNKNFNRSGLMHDCSRNGVLNIETIKKFILLCSLFGMNMFMLYTEDVYEIEGEPYFGYLRGRYTKSELKEIAEYGDAFGVEVIPCIQTLSHLNQALRWSAYNDVRESWQTLYVGKDSVYQLIEKMIKTCQEVFTSKNIHIGMDEAFDLGAFRYALNGEVIDKTEAFLSHLNKVTDICKKYDFHPMMWEDMFFKLNEKNDQWYASNNKLSEEVKKLIPDVGLVYWDYYHSEVSHYDNKFKLSLDSGKEVIFAGGAISWIGYAPSITGSIEISKAGLKSAIKNKIKSVFVTAWGDNGNECSVFASVPSLALYSNFNYYGKCNDKELSNILECVTGDSLKMWRDLELPNKLRDKITPYENPSKAFLYQDPLNGLFDVRIKEEYSSIYKKHASSLKRDAKRSKYLSHIYSSLSSLCSLLEYKTTIGIHLRKAYQENDKSALMECRKDLRIIIKRLAVFKSNYLNQWMIENKIQGFDVLDGRLGFLNNRLLTAYQFLDDYLNGKLKEIPELKEKLIDVGIDKDEPLHENGWSIIASVNSI